MPLTVAGDFTWPGDDCVAFDGVIEALAGTPLIVNLEGALIKGAPESANVASEFKFNLFSVDSVIAKFKTLNVIAVGLANNHIGDYVGGCANTIRRLEQEDLSCFGLKGRPYVDLSSDGISYRFIGTVSPLTDVTHENDSRTANLFDPNELIKRISLWRAELPELKIVVFIHWGYELSRYPLPADRAWAREAISAGADFVIGHHPHIVQGIERIKNGIVAYSLGNFVLPQVEYREKQLKYFDLDVKRQLTITLESDPILIWLRYEPEKQSIVVENKELLSASTLLEILTPFAGMSDRQYRRWFKQSLKAGVVNIKRGLIILWSYKGAWRLHIVFTYLYLRMRRFARSQLIRLGIHRPYNW